MSRPWDSGSGYRAPLSGPIYPRLLRLKNLNPSAWQRAVFVEGSVAVGAVAALADQVSAWTPLVLPVAVAAVVKFHDVLTGVLAGDRPEPAKYSTAVAVAVPAAAVAPPHVVLLRPDGPEDLPAESAQPPVEEPGPDPAADSPEPPAVVELPAEVEPPAADELPTADELPVTRRLGRLVPGPLLNSPARTRAELDSLADAALELALAELFRRGGLVPFVMALEETGQPALVDGPDVLDLPGKPGVRAVVVCRDVALPGRVPVDAIRLELEHVAGQPELVTVVYRHTGEGPAVVQCERTRVSGKRSGVRPRFFPVESRRGA